MNTAPEPKVSVIVPAYNHEAFVAEALDSVLEQSYSHLEVIVVDDGSTDGTAAVAEGRLKACKRPWRLIRQANHGAHHAINTGLAAASGEFLTILNSDDAYHGERLRKLVAAALGHQVRLVYSLVSHIDEAGGVLPEDHPERGKYLEALRDASLFPTRSFELLRYNLAVTSGNLFFHRSLYRQIGGFRPLRLCHDWDFLLRALLLEEPLGLDEPLLSYRLHGANAIVQTNPGNLQGAKETEAVLRAYFRGSEVPSNPLAPAAVTWGEYWIYFLHRFLDFVDPDWFHDHRQS